MRTIGIDPGSICAGYGVVDGGGGLTLVAGGIMRMSGDLQRRLCNLANNVDSIIREHEPDLIVVEDVFAGKNPRTALILGQARGAVLVAAGASGRPLLAIAPASAKKVVASHGRADKAQMAAAARVWLRNPPSSWATEDHSDAVCLAIAGQLMEKSAKVKKILGAGVGWL